LTFALDPDVWCPDMAVPERWCVPKEKDEIPVYHAMGNVSLRTSDTRNIKGSPAVVAVVERLRCEGHKVGLEFVSNLPSPDVRFMQVQANIFVDELNFGRCGATAREGMMLGKPTVRFIDPREEVQGAESACLAECPLVSATEATVYDVLKKLAQNPERRRAIGEASRAHAAKWWSADACSERYEGVYARLMSSRPPDNKVCLAQPERGGGSRVSGRVARWWKTLRPGQDQ